MVTLLARDGVRVNISADAASMSAVIMEFMEMFEDADAIPIPVADSATLAKVAEFCDFVSCQRTDDEKYAFETQFYNMGVNTLFEIANAANYLNIPELVDGTCEAIAETMKGKTTYQIQELFGTAELTPQELEEVRLTHPWAFEDV
ncbi:SKP1-like protein [Acanthocystis turfacea Chlorella virus Br0604L]|nr:SKP1-like protein [Acanthocystis turfacea Chlorella virus Br0604L]